VKTTTEASGSAVPATGPNEADSRDEPSDSGIDVALPDDVTFDCCGPGVTILCSNTSVDPNQEDILVDTSWETSSPSNLITTKTNVVIPLPIDDSVQGVVFQDPECPLFIPPLEEAQAEEEDPNDHEEGYPWDEEEEARDCHERELNRPGVV
jgi:hypothetical protein